LIVRLNARRPAELPLLRYDWRVRTDRYGNGDGIWVYLTDGWHNYEDQAQPTSCVHAWSWTQVYSELVR
jgi:hypothetical protein